MSSFLGFWSLDSRDEDVCHIKIRQLQSFAQPRYSGLVSKITITIKWNIAQNLSQYVIVLQVEHSASLEETFVQGTETVSTSPWINFHFLLLKKPHN